jgi:sigma-B regulation protein RsbU (phosphoserine phosphatase)
MQLRKDASNFAKFKEYYKEHYAEMLIPADCDSDYNELWRDFELLFAQRYPGKVFKEDMSFDELDDDLILLYADYTYAYWLTMLENARDAFGLAYAYFVYPVDDLNICYMIDAVRDTKTVDGKEYLLVGDVVETDVTEHQVLWETWKTGVEPDRFDVFDNEYGHNYAFYTPFIIDGEKIGLICSEISVVSVNKAIVTAVIRQVLGSIIVMLLGIIIMVILIRKNFLMRIVRLEGSVEKYSSDKDESVAEQIRSSDSGNDEIKRLSDQFADMILELKDYMLNLQHVTAEKERIGAELNVATQIQADMLPRIFPPYAERDEFVLAASMDPAKEVGGDFYDFFFVDDVHLALVVADVSGKGVPASLFMVIAKTLIKNRAIMGGSPAEVLSDVNNQLCEGNEAELFVTVWLAIIDINTGKGIAANAGHEHPVLRRAGGDFELIEYKHSPAVATMEGIRFREHEFELHPGDTLIEYTDGVSEATNIGNELFGNERLLAALNKNPDAAPEELLGTLREDIDTFVGEAPQFDDITMLCIKFFGKQ